jgi:predicted AAA+ superfamily ATPase
VSFSEQGDKKMSTYKPWREVAIPHSDVLEGSFQQSEFAADLSTVHSGKATREYQDAQAFFQRTFITEGMRLLLTSVANRLNKKGGDPVIQLQTSFGGGKTHTLLAVYHLATRKCPLHDLAGIGSLLDNAGLLDVPKARVAVLDGNQLAPGQPRKKGSTTVRTLWGELAWQSEDNTPVPMKKLNHPMNKGHLPKELLREILEAAAPCVILIDELVAFIRQFEEGKSYPAGTFDSNLSFLQALTEAIKLVPNAIMLGSLPESDVEAGSSHGVSVLKTVEKSVGRVEALWKPVATEEAFEIVRRRLFEDVVDTNARDAACEAFAEAYRSIGSGLPSETQEARYLTRLQQAYPFIQKSSTALQDWSHLQNFQRTRGVLKLMAKVTIALAGQ